MKYITVRRNFVEGECHPFFFWGDWHVGDAACAKGELASDRETIRTTPRALYANMGDNGDFIAPDGDRRFRADRLDRDLFDIGNLDELGDVQVDWLTEFEAPVVDRCVAQLGSNHPNKFDQKHQTNTMKRKLKTLGGAELIDRIWAPAMASVQLLFTDEHGHACEVKFNLHHGSHTGDADMLLRKIRMKLRFWPEVDVMARGHCHHLRQTRERRMVTGRRNTRVTQRSVFGILTGGYGKTFEGGYAEAGDMDPIDIGMARLNIYPSRHGARIEAVT